jgi:hypothetical protein
VNDPNTVNLPLFLRGQTLLQYDRYAKYDAERLGRVREGYAKLQDFIRRFVQAGGTIRAGSDPNNGMPGIGVLEEMVMFVEAGLTPMQAIQAGTINVAKTFRKDKDFGTVEVGKVADIVAVEGDPLKDIWAVSNVKTVILGGKLVNTDFHADYKNPIPNVRAWRAPPRNIKISPLQVEQGAGSATLKVTANGFSPFNKVAFNGKELETRFVSKGELDAVIPQQAIVDAGTYTVEVISPGDFAAKSSPAYLVVPFKK